jgi:uncharacterized membrane protein
MRAGRWMKNKKKAAEVLLLLLIVLTGIGLVVRFSRMDFGYERFHTDGISYEKAVVIAVVEEDLEPYQADDEHMTGYQLLRIRFLEGEEKGKELEIDNDISITHNVILQAGDRLIVCADRPGGVEPYYSVYNYDRGTGVWLAAFGLLALIILIGKKQGIRSCLGLIFTVIMVVCYLLPALYQGKSAVLSAIITVGLSSAATCFCLGGLERKTGYNILNSTLGGISAGIIYSVLSHALHVGGNSMEETESLTLITQVTGMRLDGILFAAIMVAALGAVMDVAVSLGAALNEMQVLNPAISRKELFRSGMNIGRDMIGTMTNTLILAFAGGALATLLVFISYGVQYNQLISSDFFATEVVQGIAGTSAVILTVPITAAICALGYRQNKVITRKKGRGEDR